MIKKFLRYILIFSFSLVTSNYLWGNIVFEKQAETIILVATILSLFEIFVKPVVKLLLLPITFITLGAIRIVIDTVGFYLATLLISECTVNDISTPGLNWYGFTIPAFSFVGIFAYLVTSTTTSLSYHLFSFILKRKIIK